MKETLGALLIILLFSSSVIAQDRLVELNLGIAGLATISVFPGSDDYYASFGYNIEGYYFINPKLAIGGFYTRSLNIEEPGAVDIVNPSDQEFYGSTSFLQYGISGKYSSSRAKRFSAYLIASFSRSQNVYDFEDEGGFKIADEGLAFGIGGGVCLKISKTVGFNILEATYDYYIGGMDFTKETFGNGALQLKSGLVLNLIERK